MHARRAALLVAAVALLVLGFGLASCGGDEAATEPTVATVTEATASTEATATETTTTPEAEKPTLVRIVVVGGAPQGGIVRTTVDEGDQVVLVVRSDAADEIHLHGYDISRDVAAGGTVRIAFTATLPGRFEVELEERGTQIADLTVEP